MSYTISYDRIVGSHNLGFSETRESLTDTMDLVNKTIPVVFYDISYPTNNCITLTNQVNHSESLAIFTEANNFNALLAALRDAKEAYLKDSFLDKV